MKFIHAAVHAIFLTSTLYGVSAVTGAHAQQRTELRPEVAASADGTIHVPAYDLPLSIYMSEGAKKFFIKAVSSPPLKLPADITMIREILNRDFYIPTLEKAKAAYPAAVEEKVIAGVPTYIVTPKDLAQKNLDRVLINLHGGGLTVGAGAAQLYESVPIAGAAKMRVVSINYRLAPEHKFPAAIEDAVAVYREMLKEYKPQNIGIYGSSAGSTLTAMSIAWFLKEKLPLPGAIGLFCGAGSVEGGDSLYIGAPLQPYDRSPSPAATSRPVLGGYPGYFGDAGMDDPLVSPWGHPDIISRFPPALLITGTRDPAGSEVIYAQRQLVKSKVQAELQVWEGMWHGFYSDVDIPESREMYEVTARFFNANLGHRDSH